MRDGARLKADVLRPDDGGRFPAILNLGPYQKDKLWIPPDNLEEKPNPLMNWETINPEWWVPKGYAAVRVDARGTGKSPGRTEPWSLAGIDRFLRRDRMGGGASPGATAMSAWRAFPTSPSISGSSPTSSRRRSKRSSRGRDSPISTAMRCFTAASSASS